MERKYEIMAIYDYDAAGNFILNQRFAKDIRDKIANTFKAIPLTIKENTDASYQEDRDNIKNEILADLEPSSVEAEVVAARDGLTGLNARLNQMMPVGTVVMHAGSDAPAGWLFCRGQALSRTTYKKLFDEIGTLYGSTSSTNFKLPDLQVRFPLGTSGVRSGFTLPGAVGGEENHALSIQEMPSHNHGMNYTSAAPGYGNAAGISGTPTAPTGFTNDLFIGKAGGGQAHNNMPPYIVMNYIIKY